MKKKKTNNAMRRRILNAEATANKKGIDLSKEYAISLRKAYRNIHNELSQLVMNDSLNGSSVSQLTNTVRRELKSLAIQMSNTTEEKLSEIYISTGVEMAQILNKQVIIPETFQVKSVVNQVYHGSDYSQRIWKHTNTLAGRLQGDMERLISGEASPQELTTMLQQNFNVNYKQADRLVRTEASRVYNQATEESYKRYGIDKKEFLAETDACDSCGEHDGKVYNTDSGPTLPLHPRCRCVYLPVIE